ncbi:unnamed protein product [Cylindrotheca closterium]|uniref:Uncharacterized protein n=1 Tax=Cylindrotheca closterium TaxID=2856 RepID=A0AAD2GD10_9STRA|nr:unnamed protein product [Cylindrotheca closterium]
MTTMRTFLVSPWLVHFALCIVVLVCGSINNHGERKYIPIDVEKYSHSQAEECHKAFVNVFSSSMEDERALICCGKNLDDDLSSTAYSGICQPPPPYLLFSRRLARFPDAWLLPLFPVLLRIITALFTGSTATAAEVHTKRRLYFYIILIQLRGWILYLLFDMIEEIFVSSPGTQCWYSHLLQSHYHECQGRVTDFSDHIVLYFAQILPIALVEVIHSFAVPYWQSAIKNSMSSRMGVLRWFLSSARLIPTLLLLWLGNLYVITFFGAYKTAMFFHTGPEIWIGYLVSLLLQIPLCIVQCTQAFPALTTYLFGTLAI